MDIVYALLMALGFVVYLIIFFIVIFIGVNAGFTKNQQRKKNLLFILDDIEFKLKKLDFFRKILNKDFLKERINNGIITNKIELLNQVFILYESNNIEKKARLGDY